MSLENWLKSSWIAKHKSSKEEIGDLLQIVKRDLQDCQSKDVSPDWRMNMAYNAALQLATAALAASGYKASREAHHYRTIQSLTFTIKADSKTIELFDAFRKKRNISDYERAGTVSEQEAKEMEQLAQQLRNEVNGWLKKNHPKLWPGGITEKP